MMRVTNDMMFSAGMSAMQTQQQELMQAQLQSSSGQRIQKPSDDPVGAFRDVLFSSDLSAVQSLKNTTGLASQRLQSADTNIGTVQDSMLQAYELGMQFSPGTSGSDPQVVKGAAMSALSIYQNILSVANLEMGGVPLFGGGRTTTPFDNSHLTATNVRVQTQGTGPEAAAPSGFEATIGDTFTGTPGQTDAYTITPSAATAGEYDVQLNGQLLPGPQGGSFQTTNGTLDLGNGITVNMGGTLLQGGTLSFNVLSEGARFTATPVQLTGSGGTVSTVDVTQAFSAQVAPGTTLVGGIPLSIKATYSASTGRYSVDINGKPLSPLQPVPATSGRPAYLDLGNGITLNLVGQPKDGDALYCEIVPAYQGGMTDRPVQVAGGKTLPGNVTGDELVQGGGSIGKKINILGSVTALYGAMMRGDSAEVGVQLSQLEAGRAQTSDFQSLTGVRSTQMNATATTVATEETSLQTLKANNADADMFDVASRLQKASQTLQMLTTAERQVLSVSLLNFMS